MSGYISVLLQKSSATGDWGFLLGAEPPSPNVIVTQVDTGCVAAELLEPGDRIIELEGMEANRLTQEQVNGILKSPSNRLSMVLLKRYPRNSRRNLYSSFTRSEEKTEEISSKEEKRSETESTGDYNYYEISSQTTRKEKNENNGKKADLQSNTNTGVFKAKPFKDEVLKQNDLFEVKTKEHFATQERKYYKDEEHISSRNNLKEETLKRELLEMEEKKKISSSFWTDPPKDLKSAIANAKFWKSPGSSYVSTSSIFSQLNNINNQQKKIDPREEKRQFWENCSKGRMGTDSPGSKSDAGNEEKKVEDARSKSCEPEHLKATNPFSSYHSSRNNSPSNPFFSPSPTNPFHDVPKDSSSKATIEEHCTSESKYTTSFQEEEKIFKGNIKVKSEEKNVTKSSETSDFTANREFFERATSVPTISCVKNAQDLVSERLSPSLHSKLRKPSDFINKVRADTTRSRSLQPEDKTERRETREKSVMREMPNECYTSPTGAMIDRDISVEKDAANRRFTTTTYEKVTRVGTPYENVESAWRREYRVATPSGFYDNNFEEIFQEESYVEQGPPVPSKNGSEEAVEEAYRELTVREGLEPNYGYCCQCTRQSNQIQSNGNSNTAPVGANGPPPPPPPPVVGSIPSVRIASEIGPKKSYEPPAAIQNAMMTKDKKPFTYTPGGLNLNEIRSPRMARRISRNAHTEDSCTGSIQQQQQPAPNSGQPLPPAAVAAMQPQIAVAVLPPPPPPPPPPPSGPSSPSSAPPAPALPPTSLSNKPLDYPPRPEFLSDIASHPPLRPVGQVPRSSHDAQPPEFLADIASHPPLRPVGQAPRSSYEPQPSTIQVQLKPVSPKTPVDQNDSAPIGQVPFVPRPQIEIPIQNLSISDDGLSPPIQNQVRSPSVQSGKPAVTPPTQQIRAPPTPPLQSVRAPPTPPIQSVRAPPTPPIQTVRAPPTPLVQSVKTPPVPTVQPATPPAPTPPPFQKQPSTPSTPTLNKSPAPWLTNKTAPKEVQPPWAVRQQSVEPQPQTLPVQQALQQPIQTQGYQPVTRVIPIQIEGREAATPPTPMQQYVQTSPRQTQQPSPDYSSPQQHNQSPSSTYMQTHPQYPQYPPSQQQFAYPQQQYVSPQFQQIGQTVPQQQYVQSPPVQQEVQGRTRIIPIQMEGNGKDNQQQASQKAVYQSQSSQPGNFQSRNQNGEADPRKFQTQTSWSGNPTQSRSFRVLQKITGSDDEPQAPHQQVPQGEVILVNRVFPTQATEPVSREYSGWGTNTPPLYPNYWYNPPQTPEEQQQFWEHYNAMCNYMAHMNATAMRYSPYPFPPYLPPYMPYPSDTEDYSNSSSDEMNMYGKMFKEHAQQMQQQATNQSLQSIPESSDATPASLTETEGEDTSDTDTEVEERSQNQIPSIRSVPNINIYACNSDESSEDSESEEDEEEETEDDSLPHQLSVIYEESDFSSEEGRKSNAKSPYESDNSSSSTLKNKDEDENAVKVRLPLQLKFTRSENDVEVATLIVGNSEMEASKTNETEESSLIITDIIKEENDPDVTATVILKKPKAKVLTKEREDSPVDFWKELNGESNVSKTVESRTPEDDSKQEESDFHWEDDSSSTSVQTVKKGISGNDTSSEAETAGNLDEQEEINNTREKKSAVSNEVNSEDSSESDESSEEEEEIEDKACSNVGKEQLETEEEEEDDSDSSSSSSSSDDESEHSNVFNENAGQENCLVKKKELNNSKSFEESEDDSGVTSDLSRHISETDTDPECGSELSKMSRYQRAATHSRLFKLLQEECEAEDNAEKSQSISQRKERLTLPLNNAAGGEDSLSSSSGINSPSSPIVNDRLVKELIQSLLSRKKGRHFRKLPIEKLHAAALRILQEDMDRYDSVSTSDESNYFLSPVNNYNKVNTGTYTDNSLLDPDLYGGNYYDYCDYYSTWGTADNCVELDYDIVPSKTFKILQKQAQGEATSVKVRCPRVPSSKNVREQLKTPIPSISTPIPKET